MTSPLSVCSRFYIGSYTKLLLLSSAVAIAACDGSRVSVTSDGTTDDSTVESQSPVETPVAVIPESVEEITVEETVAGVCVDTPPFNDDWGWDGTQSCLLVEEMQVVEVQEPEEVQVVVEVQEPEEVQVVGACIDTPPFNDNYGWDGTQSCLLDGVSQPPPQPQPESAPEGNLPASEDFVFVAPENYPQNPTLLVSEVTDLILVTGQSNALGAGTSYDPILDSPNNQVLAFTDSGWQVANLEQNWDLGFPRGDLDPNTPPSNNFAMHFGKRIAERRSDRTVAIVLITAPGEGIDHWREGGDFFNQIRNKVSKAINELPYTENVSTILWHQGESDGQDNDAYGDALYDLISRFCSEPWFGDGFPFICGETANSPVNNQLNKLNQDGAWQTACVEAEDLATIPSNVNSHFTGESLRTLGQRYADTYIEVYLGE